MTALATDNFNRADNADLGALWDPSLTLGGFKIVSNHVEPTAAATNAAETYNGVTWPDDQYSQAVLTSDVNSASKGPGLLVRASAVALTGYWMRAAHSATDQVRVVKYVAGVATTLADITQAWTDGDTFNLQAQGTTLKVLLNGVQIGSDMSDAATASGRAGIAYASQAGTTTTIDNWEGGDFASGGTSIAPTIGAGLLAGVAPTRVLGTMLEPVMP